jgi:chromosome partitioning protein
MNSKGGVGKTTTAVSVGVEMARRGLQVLMVDLDSQCNMSAWLGYPPPIDDDSPPRFPYRSLLAMTTDRRLNVAHLVEQVVWRSGEETREEPNLQVIASDPGLRALPVALSDPGPWLGRRLADVERQWDVVILDSGPTLDVLTIMGLTATDEVIAPLIPTAMSLEGFAQLTRAIERVRGNGQSPILRSVLPVLVTNTRMATDSIAALRAAVGDRVSAAEIPRTVRVEEAFDRRLPVFDYIPDSPVSAGYRALVDELLNTEAP